jgi:hypothetical protein
VKGVGGARNPLRCLLVDGNRISQIMLAKEGARVRPDLLYLAQDNHMRQNVVKMVMDIGFPYNAKIFRTS